MLCCITYNLSYAMLTNMLIGGLSRISCPGDEIKR